MPDPTTSAARNQPQPRRVVCAKLGGSRPGLPAAPFPNPLGERILEHISQEAWSLWLVQSRMVINEYRLNLSSADARTFLMQQCERFLFGDADPRPADFVPPSEG